MMTDEDFDTDDDGTAGPPVFVATVDGSVPGDPEDCYAYDGEDLRVRIANPSGENGYDDHDTDAGCAWLNSASVSVEPGDDRVTVSISIGDPRGAFVMSVERVRYIDAETGEERDDLRLSVPHPESSFLHLPLAELASRGYYRVGR